jgi:low temperature requirement protein LtrA
MSDDSAPDRAPRAARLLRRRQDEGHDRVTNIELFFDLVFVYAVTQLSHTLLGDLSLPGVLKVLVLFLAVWWVWIFTGWITNWLDPERLAVRMMLIALMLAGLLLSTALPAAFGRHGLIFAAAYVFMQVGRTAFMLWTMRGSSPANTRNFQRIAVWLSTSGLLWMVGAFQEPAARWAIWLVALAIEYAGPASFFYVPGMGRSSTGDWDIEGSHLAERCSLFVLIALGESIVVTGSGFADTAAHTTAWLAFIAAFMGSVAMWWIYFDLNAERGSRSISAADDPGRFARVGYTYLHLLIVAGIVVGAVGDELSIAHPDHRIDVARALVLIGGPMMYLLGCALFKKTVNQTPFPLSHLVGLGLLVMLIAPALVLSSLLLSISTTVVLIIVAVWETWALRGLRDELSPTTAH